MINHPTKVCWNQFKGRTTICIFEGILKQELIVEVLKVPSINTVFPGGHRLMLAKSKGDSKY